jgi:hypothetical protein
VTAAVVVVDDVVDEEVVRVDVVVVEGALVVHAESGASPLTQYLTSVRTSVKRI